MAFESSYIFYSYNDSNGHGISSDVLSTYSQSLIFDSENRTIYAKGGIYGNHQMGSYHGEIFNDYKSNNASGNYASTFGGNTVAQNAYEMATGHSNVSTLGKTLFSVGNGNNDSRANAFEVQNNGTTYINGTAYISGSTYVNGKNTIDELYKRISVFPGIYNGVSYYIWCGTSDEYEALGNNVYDNVIYITCDHPEGYTPSIYTP